MTTTTRYRYFSGDTHLEVPAQRWTARVPAQYRDRAPRTVRLANGADGFLIEGSPVRENAFDLYDGLGSVANVTDEAGDVLVTYTYDAFGGIRTQSASSDNYWTFTGEQTDEVARPVVGALKYRGPRDLAGSTC
jgi:hypothetical protein